MCPTEGLPLRLAVASFGTSATTIIIVAMAHSHSESGRLRARGLIQVLQMQHHGGHHSPFSQPY